MVINMKCELKYIVHNDIESLRRTTKLEVLIILILSICVGVFSKWHDVFYIIIIIFAVLGLVGYYFQYKEATSHCKKRNE